MSADREPLLRARDVTLAYGRRIVVREVSLDVHRGDYWFVLGRNGAGKTTLLHALLGTHPIAAGTLWRDPAGASPRATGFVPQRCDLNRSVPTTVREFVLLGLVGIDEHGDAAAARLHHALGAVGLTGLERRSYWALSGGQRQRALVARALVRQPSLLVLDEPMSGLDLAAEAQILELLAARNRDGSTIVYVTHKVAVARRYGSHVALLHDDTVTAGPAAAVLTPEALERAFGVEIDTGRERGRGPGAAPS